MDIGIFGVTANPPHLSHWQVIKAASEKVDEVWVSLVYNHAFGKKFIDYDLRLEMLKLLLEENPIENVFIKELDKEYYQKYEQTVYSYDLLKYLKSYNQNKNFKLVIGEDNYQPEIWKKFLNYDKIDNEFGVVVIEDKGVHSTNIREAIENNEDISTLTGKKVENFIKQNNLYRGNIKCRI